MVAGRCCEVHESIINLINNHAQFAYAPYDRHIGIVSMLYRLLDRLERTEDIYGLMRYQCTRLAYYYLMYHKYPTAADSIEDAIDIDMGALVEDYQTSAFWGTMLEWMVLMDQSELYQFLQSFLKDDLKNVTKCVWFIRSEEESKFYDIYAMNQAGEGIALQLEKTFDKFKEKVMFIMKQYEKEQFSLMNIHLKHWNLLFVDIMDIWCVLNEKNRDIWGKNLTPKFPQMGNSYPPNLKNQKSEILESKMNFPPK